MRNTDSFMLIRKRGKELGKEYGQQLNWFMTHRWVLKYLSVILSRVFYSLMEFFICVISEVRVSTLCTYAPVQGTWSRSSTDELTI
jgi:hypothetical protein